MVHYVRIVICTCIIRHKFTKSVKEYQTRQNHIVWRVEFINVYLSLRKIIVFNSKFVCIKPFYYNLTNYYTRNNENTTLIRVA